MENSVPHPASRIWFRIRILAILSGGIVKLYCTPLVFRNKGMTRGYFSFLHTLVPGS
jgi:hypothetical protein